MTSATAPPAARARRFARELKVLVGARVLGGDPPHRLPRLAFRLWRFGPTLAGGYATAAVKAPHRVAVVDETTSRTYAELEARVKLIARGLAARGVDAGAPVALLGRNSVAFVETLVAVSRLGVDALLLSTFGSAHQVRELVARERPKLLVVDVDLLPLVARIPDGVQVVTTTPRPGHTSLDDLAAATAPEPTAGRRRGRLVVLTSGTTGTPKGAARPAPTSLGPAASILSRLRLRKHDTIMISCPLFHTWGLGMLQIAPSLAASVVLRRRADAEVVLQALSAHRCTALVAVPVVLERLMVVPPDVRARYDLTPLRVVASSGSPMTAAVAERFQDTFGEVLYNVYGSTEFSWATIATPQDLRAVAGTAGRPPLGTRLQILDDEGRPTAVGQVGRIFVGNDLLFEGYTDGRDSERRGGLMATGDKGFLDDEGRLTVVGREDDLIISGGEKIYPLEVEQVLMGMPGVREVAVVGRPDPSMGQRVVSYVVCHGERPDPEDVREYVRQRLARFCVPRQVVFLEELPRTATGKVVPRLLPVPTPDLP